jgi:signal transduction histidine kinase
MSGTTLQRTTDQVAHVRRATPSQTRPRANCQSHMHRSLPISESSQPAVLQERARIARELHDSVSQTLYAITLGTVRASSLLQQGERGDAQRIIENVLELANVCQSELRALIKDIRSDPLASDGLDAALTKLAADMQTHNNLDIQLSLADVRDVPAEMHHALIMIVREALHNVVKHSYARRVDIVLEQLPDQLMLLIADDGCGFDSATRRVGHFGLQTMSERASAVGGGLVLRSVAGLGTELRVSVPHAT